VLEAWAEAQKKRAEAEAREAEEGAKTRAGLLAVLGSPAGISLATTVVVLTFALVFRSCGLGDLPTQGIGLYRDQHRPRADAHVSADPQSGRVRVAPLSPEPTPTPAAGDLP